MKLPFFDQAYSTSHHQVETIDSEYTVLFGRKNYTFHHRLFSFLVNLLAFSRLILRLLLHGFQPQIHQRCDREDNCYWYAYYPLSGTSKVLASDAEIKQWLELTQEM